LDRGGMRNRYQFGGNHHGMVLIYKILGINEYLARARKTVQNITTIKKITVGGGEQEQGMYISHSVMCNAGANDSKLRMEKKLKYEYQDKNK
jgi:hypothetical protein